MKAKLVSLVLVLWLTLFGYACIYSMINSDLDSMFRTFDICVRGLLIFSAFVLAFSRSQYVASFLVGLYSLGILTFVSILILFDQRVAVVDVVVAVIALGVCSFAVTTVFRRCRLGVQQTD